MLVDEIKKANIQAMKDKDAVARSIYSVILNKIMLETIKKREKVKSLLTLMFQIFFKRQSKSFLKKRKTMQKLEIARKLQRLKNKLKLQANIFQRCFQEMKSKRLSWLLMTRQFQML